MTTVGKKIKDQLSKENFREFAVAAIQKYFDKGMLMEERVKCDAARAEVRELVEALEALLAGARMHDDLRYKTNAILARHKTSGRNAGAGVAPVVPLPSVESSADVVVEGLPLRVTMIQEPRVECYRCQQQRSNCQCGDSRFEAALKIAIAEAVTLELSRRQITTPDDVEAKLREMAVPVGNATGAVDVLHALRAAYDLGRQRR